MIEEFAKLIPPSQKNKSGKAFYSGRRAFGSQSDLYVLGTNPGGNPDELLDETVTSHTEKVLKEMPENWSAYRDESWSKKPPGTDDIQLSLLHLFNRLGLDAGQVPASNLVFQRSTEMENFRGSFHQVALECWPFHKAVIENLGVRVVVFFGLTKHDLVRRLLNAHSCKEHRTDNEKRIGITCKNVDGLTIVTLAHPTPRRGYPWTGRTPRNDPTDSVVKVLN